MTGTQHNQVMNMEGSIEDAINSASILYRLLDDLFGTQQTEVTGSPNRYIINDSDISDMYFIANLISGSTNKTKQQWKLALEAGR